VCSHLFLKPEIVSVLFYQLINQSIYLFLLLSLEHRESVKRFVSLQFNFDSRQDSLDGGSARRKAAT
jgi:hypothetical protein